MVLTLNAIRAKRRDRFNREGKSRTHCIHNTLILNISYCTGCDREDSNFQIDIRMYSASVCAENRWKKQFISIRSKKINE